jgi:O-antigen/teichoic acid export membrane protein
MARTDDGVPPGSTDTSPPRAEPPPADLLSTAAAGPAAVRGGALRGVGFLIGSLASVVSAALLFHHFSSVDIGHYVTILSLVAVVAGLSDLGLTAVGVREAAVRDADERPALLRDLLGLRLTLTLVGIAVMCAAAALGYSATIVAGVAIAGVGLLLQVTQDNYSVLLTVDLRLGWVALLDALRQVSTLLFVALLVLADARLLAFVAVSVAAGAVCLAVVAPRVRGRRSLRPTFNRSRWRKMLIDVLPYSAAVAAAALYFRVAVIVTSLLASGVQAGYFGASFRVIEFLTIIPALLAGAALPIFARSARDDVDRLGYALGRVFEVALIVGVGVAVLLAVGAGLVLTILGGSKLLPAKSILAIQGVALAGTFVSTVWSNGLLSLHRHRALLLINLAALTLSLVAISILVTVDSARGAAIGLAAGEVATAVITGLVLARHHPALRPPLRVVPRVAIAAALGLTPLLLTSIPVIARVAIAAALYVGALLVTRAFPEELGALTGALPWRRSSP